MSEWAPRRFWKAAATERAPGGHTVTLDGRAVRTPAKALLVVPTEAVAQVIAAEWDAQEERVDPNTMPATRMANSAIDKVSVQRDEIVPMLAAYGDADLLCYRADSPAELVERQAATWDPLLDWAETRYGARLEARAGVMHVPQSDDALARLARPVGMLGDFELAAFHDLVTLSGSLVIALASVEQVQPDGALWQASRLDELWQEEQWGPDEEAAESAALRRAAFLRAAELFRLARGGGGDAA